jgi:hypothetical protein
MMRNEKGQCRALGAELVETMFVLLCERGEGKRGGNEVGNVAASSSASSSSSLPSQPQSSQESVEGLLKTMAEQITDKTSVMKSRVFQSFANLLKMLSLWRERRVMVEERVEGKGRKM